MTDKISQKLENLFFDLEKKAEKTNLKKTLNSIADQMEEAHKSVSEVEDDFISELEKPKIEGGKGVIFRPGTPIINNDEDCIHVLSGFFDELLDPEYSGPSGNLTQIEGQLTALVYFFRWAAESDFTNRLVLLACDRAICLASISGMAFVEFRKSAKMESSQGNRRKGMGEKSTQREKIFEEIINEVNALRKTKWDSVEQLKDEIIFAWKKKHEVDPETPQPYKRTTILNYIKENREKFEFKS